jgi:hypothetical protein
MSLEKVTLELKNEMLSVFRKVELLLKNITIESEGDFIYIQIIKESPYFEDSIFIMQPYGIY